MPMTPAPVAADHLTIYVLDTHNYPLATAKVPHVAEITTLFAQAAAINPVATPELLLRAIIHAGLRDVKGHLARKRLPPTINLKNL